MFTFRKLTILFFILLFALNMIHFIGCRMEWFVGNLCSNTYLYILILFCLYIGISVMMAFFICSDFHHTVICKGKTSDKTCAITFDDGPDEEITPVILNILKREQLPATFFVIGKKLHGQESLILEMDTAGHLIGNHSWSHSVFFDFFTGRRMRKELTETANRISDITGKFPILFRPPYGVINPAMSGALKRLTFYVIGWNVRSYDTLHRDQKKTAARILRKVSPGAIILLHDHLKGSPQLLEEVIDGLKTQGYKIVPITQLTHGKAYA